MFWFVNIAILFLAAGASRAIANWLKQRQKPALPGPFTQPTVAAGQGLIVTYGTTIGEGVCTWFGGAKLVELTLSAIDNISRIGTRKTVAYMYKVTCQLVLGVNGGLNGASLVNLLFDDNRALSDEPALQPYDFGDGTVVSFPVHGEFPFNDRTRLFVPNAFGGKGRGGGITAVGGDRNEPFGGWIWWYVGDRKTGPNPVMEEYLGVGNVPNYNDLMYVVLDDVNVGESTSVPPIKWITYRQPMHVPGGGIGSLSVNDRVIKGRRFDWPVRDLSPIVIGYDILVNNFYGLNQPAGMTTASGSLNPWEVAHRQLQNEGIGMSMRFAGTRENAEAAIREIERTMDGHFDRDPNTFQWTPRLNRNEAATPEAFAALPQFGKNELLGCTLTKPDWGETFNEVTVEYSDADAFFERRTVTVQHSANIAMTGSVRPLPNVQYLSVTYRPTALKLAARDLKKVAIPLYKGQITVTRAAWRLTRGQVFRLTYDHKYPGVTDMLFRVAAINFGDESDNKITVDIVEDVFSYDDILRAAELPRDPRRQPTIVPPRVTAEIAGKISDDVGQLTITLEDPQHRTYEIATRSQSGTAAPTAWVVVETATPNTSDFNFPNINPVTDTDLNGDHVFTAPMSFDADTIISYRIRFVRYGTIADPTSGYGELLGSATIAANVRPPAAPGVSSDAAIRWSLVGTGAGGVIVPGAYCQYEIPADKAGSIVGWAANASPGATIAFDIWKSAGGTPTIADSLGLSGTIRLVAATAGSGTITPIHFDVGDVLRINVAANDLATAARLELLIQYDP